ncbi:unnamed protein product, partial [marine sediment metagenome]
ILDLSINGASWTTGVSGTALDFDGINDYVNTSLTQSLSSNAFSVFLWAKDIPNGNKYIISQAYIFSPFTSDWLLGNPNHGLWFNDEKIDGNNQLSDGNWHHIGFIFDGIEAKLYIDGAQHNSSIIPPEVGGIGPVVFMTRADLTTGFVSGTIDEIYIYNHVLNPIEIQNLYQQYAPTTPSTPSTPSGPTTGKPGINYEYNTTSIDIDEDNIYYLWDWDDGSDFIWLGPYSSGEICTRSHTWTVEGTYNVKVKAKDQIGLESNWSNPLTVEIIMKPPIADANGPYYGTTDDSVHF